MQPTVGATMKVAMSRNMMTGAWSTGVICVPSGELASSWAETDGSCIQLEVTTIDTMPETKQIPTTTR